MKPILKRRRQTRQVLVVGAVALLSLTPGCGDEQESPGPCAEALRTSEDVRCMPEEACAQAFAEPDALYWWTVDIDENERDANGDSRAFTEAVQAQNYTCIRDLALAQEGAELVNENANECFDLRANGHAIEPLRNLERLNRLSVYRHDFDCSTMELAACEADAFCYPERGSRLDRARGCWENDVFFACFNTNATNAGDEDYHATTTEGTCWNFSAIPGGTIPESLTLTRSETCRDDFRDAQPCP